jgi:hypothetical protein
MHIYITFTLWFHFLLHLYSLEKNGKGIFILIATMLIDLDHLLVEPIFEQIIDVALISTFYMRITLC